MLKFNRNKLVTIARKNDKILSVNGVLDDDIYGLEIDLEVDIAQLKIISIEGRWKRYTTPECPRALGVLHEAVGISINDDDFSNKVNRIINRKACRHFANIFLECCHAVEEAISILEWEDSRKGGEDQSFGDYTAGNPRVSEKKGHSVQREAKEEKKEKARVKDRPPLEKIDGGIMIDLHTHSSPASKCSSAPVDDLIEEAKRIGLDGICLTDHNFEWDDKKVNELKRKHDFLVLKGNEILTDQGDILVFGLDEDIEGVIKLDELRKKVEDAEGFMIAAHPFRGFLVVGVGQLGLTADKAKERNLFKLVDAVEVLNGKVTERENGLALEVGEGLGLTLVGGSDAHEVEEVGIYATHFPVEIKDEKDLVKALKDGDCRPVAYRKDYMEKK
jgi:predicted metal-dependent phosphoesterase TrpH